MKILVALCAIVAVSTANVIITATDHHRDVLGRNKCTWGPSYWCENIKNAAKCKTTRHCINTSWTHMEVPEDNDSVCNICKDMVQQARDQLESNQTQQDLKDVFEGSCKLMHVKPIVNECIKIVDEYIPELVETLSSQMNPSVVCTVAGLCNSAHIDSLLHQYGESIPKIDEVKSRSLERDELEPDECSKCYTVATHMEFKLNNTGNDGLLRQMLNACAYLGTFSDACSAIVLTHFDLIRAHLRENFKAQNICHLSGQCSDRFHVHEDASVGVNVEVKPLSSVGVVDVNDDLPCKLCEQLVGHLRDLLVANTTEAEFEDVMRGFCKQMKSFADECTAIVEEYYPQIYEYLTKGLNSNVLCQMATLCPAPGKQLQNEQIWPLVPKNAAEVGMRIFQEAKENLEKEKQMELSKSEVEAMQLPIERLMPFPISQGGLGVEGKGSCAFCEYVLHYIQEAITDPVAEDKVKQAMEKVCKKLPEAVEGECNEFIDNYGDAIVAILAQKIDPSQVCPMLRVCPSAELMHIWESVPAKYVLATKQEKPNCPLCLLAVSQIYNVIKNNKTEASIQAELDKLCSHLPASLTDQCTDLVKGYSKELIEMLLADLTPEEVCTYIKLCDDSENVGPRNVIRNNEDAQMILTNEIPGARESDEESRISLNPLSVVCELLLREVAKRVGNNKNRDTIKHEVHKGCNHVGILKDKCNSLVNKHGDQIIKFMIQDVASSAICSLLNLRSFNGDLALIEERGISPESECSLCKYAMHYVDDIVTDPITENKAKEVIAKLCTKLGNSIQGECSNFVKRHGDSIVQKLAQAINPEAVCPILRLCPSAKSVKVEKSNEAPSCPLCMMAIRKLYKIIENNKTEANIEMELNKLCSHLPQKWKSECSDLVQTYSHELVELLLADLTPKEVCSYLKLCDDTQNPISRNMFNSKEDEEIFTGEVMGSMESDEELGKSLISRKDVCKRLLQVVDKQLGNNRNKDNVDRKVHEGCDHLGSSEGKCNELVNEYGGQIINYLLQGIPSSAICDALKLRHLNENLAPAALGDDSMESDEESRISLNPLKHVCKLLVRKLDKRLVSNKRENEAVSAIHKECKHLGWLAHKCNKLINKHGKQIVDYLLQDVAPSAICSLLRLRSLEDLTSAALKDDSMETVEDSRLSLNPLCDVCQLAMREVDKELGSNRSKANVNYVVHRICNNLPIERSACNKLVNKYGDQIVDVIVKQGIPLAACTALRLCVFPADALPPISIDGSVESDEEPMISINPAKEVCKLLLHEVAKRVGNDKNRNSIACAVYKGCNHLGALKSKCNSLVDKHGDQIIKFLIQDVAPDAVCALLSLRNFDGDLALIEERDILTEGAVGAIASDEEPRISINPLKHVCKFLVGRLDKGLVSDKSEDEAVSAVRSECRHLGVFLGGKCNTLVNKHGKQIVDYLLQDVAPDAICSLLRLRSLDADLTSAALRDDSVESGEESRISINPAKVVCKLLLHEVAKRVGNDKDRNSIASTVHEGCDHLGALKGKCNSLVDKYGDQIINFMIEDVAPDAICALLSLRNFDGDLALIEERDILTEGAVGAIASDEEPRISINPLKHVCKFLVGRLDKGLVSDKSEDEAVSAVRSECRHLGVFLGGKCNTLVNKHGKQIVDYLLQDVAPDAICSLLRLRSLDADLTSAALRDDSVESGEESRISINPAKVVCKLLLHEVAKRVGNDKDRNSIASTVHEGCDHLGALKGKCNSLVDKYGDQIINFMIEDVAPDAICALLSLRNFDGDLALIEERDILTEGAVGAIASDEEPRISINPLKHVCKFLVGRLDKGLVSDKSEDEAVSAVRSECRHLGVFLRGKCNTLVNKHGKQIVDSLLQDVAPSAICSLLRLRSLDADLTSAALRDDSVESGEESRISINPAKVVCKLLLHEVAKRVGNDKDRNSIASTVHEVCDHLGALKGKCNSLVDKYGDQIINFMIEDVAPDAICALLSLRNFDGDLALIEERDILTEGAVGAIASDEEPRISINPLKHVCKFLVGRLDKGLVSDKSEDEAVSAVRSECRHLGVFLGGKCNTLVNKHGKQIVDYLLQDVAPDAICSLLRLRSLDADLTSAALRDDSVESGEESRISINPAKVVCKLLLHEVAKRVGNDKDRNSIASTVHEGCDHLGALKGKCNSLVDKYGDQIINFMIEDVAPDAICALLSLRNFDGDLALIEERDILTEGAVGAIASDEEPRISINPLKHVCKFLVGRLDKGLVSDKSEDEAVSAVRSECRHLGVFLGGKCNTLVNKHGKQIVDYLLQDVAPDAICSLLRLRSLDADLTSAALRDDSVESGEESRISINPAKVVCKLLLHEVAKRVGNDKDRNSIASTVHEGCDHLGALKGKCNSLVDKYGDQIINFMIEDVAPDAICALLSLRNFDGDLALIEERDILTEGAVGAIASDEEPRISINPLKHVCKFLVGRLDKGLVSDKSEDEAVSAVRSECRHLGVFLGGKCNTLVNKHGKQIVDYLLQDVAPDAICSLLRLRSLDADLTSAALRDDSVESGEESRISINPAKVVCKLLLHEVAKRVGNDKDRNSIASTVHEGCDHLGALKGKCNSLVDKYGDQIINFMIEDVAPDAICALLSLRNFDGDLALIEERDILTEGAVGAIASDEEPRISINPLKHVCKFLVGRLDKGLVSDKSEDEAVSAVRSECRHLGVFLGGKCNTLVNKHGKQIVDYLLQDVAPDAICSLLRLRSLDADLTSAALRDDSVESGEESRISINPAKVVCKLLLHEVAKRVGNDKDRNSIASTVHEGCDHLGALKGKCNSLVDKYGDQIINFMIEDVAPDAVCALLSLRNFDGDLALIEERDILTEGAVGAIASDEEPRISINPLKHVCKFLVGRLDKGLVSDKSEDEAVSAVRSECRHLGVFLRGKCNTLVNKHGKQIVDSLLQDVAPSAICSLLRLRSLDADLTSAALRDDSVESGEEPMISINPAKEVCKLLLHEVAKRVGNDKNRNSIACAVHKGCNHLGALKSKCNSLVDKHGDQIIKFLIQDVAPDAVCALLSLHSLAEDLVPVTIKASATECAVCDALVSAVHHLLGNSAVGESIEKVVLKACNHIPGKYQSKCKSLVQTHGQNIIKLINQHVNPRKICSRIHLCNSNDRLMVSLENSRIKQSYEKDPTKRCVPAYWCSTDATAIECNTVEYCRSNVWKSNFAPVMQHV